MSSIHGHKGPAVILPHDETWFFHSVSVIGFRQCLDNPVFHHGGTDWIDRHIYVSAPFKGDIIFYSACPEI